jgi:predicted component of viral defense system (DUF524 family)
MGTRLELQTIFENILGSKNVYFQPPENIKINYPCIIYKRNMEKINFADNNPYNKTKRYSVTIIDRNPDSLIPDKISNLPMCSYDRSIKLDGLNQDIYNLYF